MYCTVDRKGESVQINISLISSIRLTTDDNKNKVYLIRMNNGDSIYLNVKCGEELTSKSKQI